MVPHKVRFAVDELGTDQNSDATTGREQRVSSDHIKWSREGAADIVQASTWGTVY